MACAAGGGGAPHLGGRPTNNTVTLTELGVGENDSRAGGPKSHDVTLARGGVDKVDSSRWQAGELLAAMSKHPLGPDRSQRATDLPPRLDEMAVSQIESSRWRAVASVLPDRFERHLAEEQAAGREFTTDELTCDLDPGGPPTRPASPRRGALSSARSSPRRMKLSDMESYLAHSDPGGLEESRQAARIEWLPVSPARPWSPSSSWPRRLPLQGELRDGVAGQRRLILHRLVALPARHPAAVCPSPAPHSFAEADTPQGGSWQPWNTR